MAGHANAAPAIIKRKKNVVDGGHHGGAWKIAYADFVTAMMAFFMLMWLLSATTKEQRVGIADYFNPTIATNRTASGGDGLFGGDSLLKDKTLAQTGTGEAAGVTENSDAAALSYATASGSDRVYLVDPSVKVLASGVETLEPASARVAGLIAKSDNDRGFWWSPSNQEILGIVGTERPIDFVLGDTASRANLLNAGNVATIIRQNGFRLWGNRTLSSDPKWAFLSVRRTADLINDSILRAHLWAVDRNITRTYLSDVADSVNAYLKSLQAQGAIIGGECVPSADLNTSANISAGKVYFDVKFTTPYPAEHITFRSALVNDYLSEIV